MKKIFLISAILIVIVFSVLNTKAEENSVELYTRSSHVPSLYTSDEIKTAFQCAYKIKTIVETDNLSDFADMIEYPIIIHGYKSKDLKIKNKQMFLKTDKNIIFNNHMKQAVSRKDIFDNYQGFMIGNGNIWFFPLQNNTCKIIAINIIK